MLLKGILCLCIQAVLFKAVFTQCAPPCPYPRAIPEPLCRTNMPIAEAYNVPGLITNLPIYGRVVGGNLIVDTSAPHTVIGPAGVAIFSDNLVIEGPVFVSGHLPFLGTVGLEGIVPAAGNSAVSYGCGTNNIGMINDGINGPVIEGVLPIAGSPGCARCIGRQY